MENQEQSSFYIGWQESAPPDFARRVRRFVLALAFVAPAAAALIALSQSGFASSTFELGKITELEGVLVKSPVPVLRIYRGLDALGLPVFQEVLLVGKGKHGAVQTIEKMGGREAALFGKTVRLKGSLIYHDGRTLMEFDANRANIREISPQKAEPVPDQKVVARGAFIGEIADPKCLFGVMKPGFGKPHRSCAVRCIAGGITPVLKSVSSTGETAYFLLVGADGSAINETLLPFVGDQVAVCGEVKKMGDWLVLYQDAGRGISRIPGRFDGSTAWCR